MLVQRRIDLCRKPFVLYNKSANRNPDSALPRQLVVVLIRSSSFRPKSHTDATWAVSLPYSMAPTSDDDMPLANIKKESAHDDPHGNGAARRRPVHARVVDAPPPGGQRKTVKRELRGIQILVRSHFFLFFMALRCFLSVLG